MPRFVLIEHSLRKIGGHFFQYAEDILGAAERAGLQPVLAAHQSFRDSSRLPPHWSVHPLFPYDWERIHRVQKPFRLRQLRAALLESRNPFTAYRRAAAVLEERFKPTVSRVRWWRHRSRMQGFARACAELFDRVGIDQDDQVFCPTMGDADFLGLVRFLESNPRTKRADWHLQFHMNVCAPRESSMDRKARALNARLAKALADVSQHRLHFYTTTDELRQQYNRLGVAEFTTLPWPVGPRFHAHAVEANVPSPLRVVCAGDVRHEKGAAKLGQLVERLWDDLLATGQIQMLFQLDQKRRSAAMLGLRRPIAVTDSTDPARFPQKPLVAIKHPLDPNDYASLIANAHVGLLMYDAAEYYARCSGILVEFLSAGVPIITPDDCWLSRQFSSARSVGRTADSAGEVHRALREMLDNYREYQLAARRFSVRWREQHSPNLTINILQQNSAHARQPYAIPKSLMRAHRIAS